MADPTQQPPAQPQQNDPGYVQRLINQLKAWNPIKASADPKDPTGTGGAARGNAIDKAVQEAGG